MADPASGYPPPKTTMSVVPPSTMSPQIMTHPPPSPAERFVHALGHDYNAIPVPTHFPREVSPRVTTPVSYPMPLSLIPNMPSVRLGSFPTTVPPGMMELRSPMTHQPQSYMPTHPTFQIPYQAISPTMVPMESPSPTPISPGFVYGSVSGFSPSFHQPNMPESPRKPPEAKEKAGLGWLDAAQRILEASNGPLHIDEIRKRILEQDILKSNARSSLEAALNRDIHRVSKRFRKVKEQVYRLVTQEELTAQVKKQIEMTAKHARNVQASVQAKVNKTQQYKSKYLYLKRSIKQLVFENASLGDVLSQTEEKLSRSKIERRFLLNRLLNYMAMTGDMSLLDAPIKTEERIEPVRKLEKETKKRKVRNKHRRKRSRKIKVVDPQQEETEGDIRKKKVQTNVTKHYMLPIPLQESGEPVFPIMLANLKVHSLGSVNLYKSKYYDKSHIYPVGYCSSRQYAKYNEPSKSMWYTCKILERGLLPMFEIHCEEGSRVPFCGDTINICHQRLMEAINSASGKRLVDDTRGSGAEFFGISNPTIRNLIQNLPNSDNCDMYKMMQFETCPEKDRKKLESWCAEDPRIDFNALQRSQEGLHKRQDSAGGIHSHLTVSMTDSERLRSFLSRSNSTDPLSTGIMADINPVKNPWTMYERDIDMTDHIDVT